MKTLFLIRKSYKQCDFQKIKKWFIFFFIFSNIIFLILSYFICKENNIKSLEVNRSIIIWNYDSEAINEHDFIEKQYKCEEPTICGNADVIIMDTYEHAENFIDKYGQNLEAVFYDQTDFENIYFLENFIFICLIILLIISFTLLILFIFIIEDCIKNENNEIYLLNLLGYTKTKIACIILLRILYEILKKFFVGSIIIILIVKAYRELFSLKTILILEGIEFSLIMFVFLAYFISFKRIINKTHRKISNY